MARAISFNSGGDIMLIHRFPTRVTIPFSAARRSAIPTAGRDAFDPETNVRLGIRYIAYLHRQFRRLDVALTAYNRGPEAVRAMLAENDGQLPQDVYLGYASKVMTRYKQLKKRYAAAAL